MTDTSARLLRASLIHALLAVGLCAQSSGAATPPSQPARAAIRALKEPGADQLSEPARRKLFRAALAEPSAWSSLEQAIDDKLAALERSYADLLDEEIRATYERRLQDLKDEDLREVARVRRVWRNYILRPSTQLHFQQHFLLPATKVGELLLPDVAAIQTKSSKRLLRRMHEFDGYRHEVREALELGADPTTKKFAPTGIPMPKLSRVRTYEEHLDHLYRSMSVASSVAPKEARDILLGNAIKARFVDYEEAEFVLYANEIRGLMGVISWQTDHLACAATRDHSKDRVDGNASGHFNDLPGKRGFTDRLRRFGTGGSAEGAGGGANGRSYLHGLSYGGGHTGPLYSMRRNQVGCGRFGNCYTSTYGLKKGLLHPCQASTGELFMPPGIGLDDITADGLKDAYYALQFDNYVGARELVADAKVTTKMDKFVRRYLTVAIEVEADWQLECIAHVAAVGDLYTISRMIEGTRGKFGDSLNKRLRPYEKRIAASAGQAVVAIGEAYLTACKAKDAQTVARIAAEHGDTVYGQAAAHYQAAQKAGKQAHALEWFLTADKYLARYEYMNSH